MPEQLVKASRQAKVELSVHGIMTIQNEEWF
jgi:hypothetical protein